MSDWIEREGSHCPVGNSCAVDVRFRSGLTLEDRLAGELSWLNMGVANDIIAYRIVSRDMPEDFGKQNQVKYERGGKDLIDRWHERYSIEEFRVLMWAMMEKYNERLGKKDDIAQEVRKIADYAQRWADKEGEV